MISPGSLLFRRLVWAAVLGTGFGTLWFVLVLVLGSAVPVRWKGRQRPWPARDELAVASDGTVLIRSTPRANPRGVRYRGLDGRPRSEPAGTAPIEGTFLEAPAPPAAFFPGRLGWERRLKAFVDEHQPGLVWYFVHDGRPDGSGYFVGYDRPTRARVGFIGELGFRPDPVPTGERFAVSSPLVSNLPHWGSARTWIYAGRVLDGTPAPSRLPSRSVYVPTATRLRLVDLGTRTVRTVFGSSEPIASIGFPQPPPPGEGGPSSRDVALLVRTAGQVHALDHEHAVVRSFTMPDADRERLISWYEVGDGRAVAEVHRPWRTRDDENLAPRTVYAIAADGSIRGRTEADLQSGMMKWSDQPEAILLRCALPAPAALSVIEPSFVVMIDQEDGYAAAVRAMFRRSWPSLAAVLVVAAVLALAAWRRGSAFALPARERVAWLVFVSLFGIPGYAGYLLHRRWPVRVRCPHCRAMTPRDRPACAGCGTRFPAPAPKGIEIFA